MKGLVLASGSSARMACSTASSGAPCACQSACRVTTMLVRPGSGLMTELALPAPGCRTRFVAFWSDGDQVIVPHLNARLDQRGEIAVDDLPKAAAAKGKIGFVQ